MLALLLIALAGGMAQLVNGALGMGYGVTSMSLLLAIGVTPALASATIHLAQLGTTLTSGVAHWRFGNVDWRVVGLMGVPGGIGGFWGAITLTSIPASAAKPLIATFLFALGVLIILRFSRPQRQPRAHGARLPSAFLSPLGAFAGFMNAAGGGGWGPIGAGALLASGRLEPRRVVGSINAAEFLVTVGASAGFIIGLSLAGINFGIVAALLAGGVVVAPFAAWIARHLPAPVLGTAAGGLILVTNWANLAGALNLPGLAVPAGLLALTAVWAAAVLKAVRVVRAQRLPAPVPA